MKLERTGGVDLNSAHHTCAHLLTYGSPHSFIDTCMHVYVHVHGCICKHTLTDRQGGRGKQREESCQAFKNCFAVGMSSALVGCLNSSFDSRRLPVLSSPTSHYENPPKGVHSHLTPSLPSDTCIASRKQSFGSWYDRQAVGCLTE